MSRRAARNAGNRRTRGIRWKTPAVGLRLDMIAGNRAVCELMLGRRRRKFPVIATGALPDPQCPARSTGVSCAAATGSCGLPEPPGGARPAR